MGSGGEFAKRGVSGGTALVETGGEVKYRGRRIARCAEDVQHCEATRKRRDTVIYLMWRAFCPSNVSW
ncbi:hypothetical protein ASPFODRAFT_53709 [Aspergillus luchuensis CBS 106.47]|uniref:Uncharacterized protein n=1 Tax=Aspergillus luchuensis (strain CBS 106.47) TaxID=1137211 RepID=A0A1M3T0C8_ASPLC|nr:hypothetical protein ASPFODRAFT_53709 [Aspergillus luchuensis CBS 106.47]